ncbi:MAG: Gfo/Idh/MocA family oxidoreductase [Victivallaceae bacterium]|nr:Gfo/Idh/MocA family oxidoreductase [Victivallaceae bacterium]
MSEKIKIAVLGCGSRSRTVVDNLLAAGGDMVDILAIYDPDAAVMETAAKQWKMPEAKRCTSFQEAIDCPGVSWVMIFSPNVHHCEQAVAAFDAGKHVFSEKPMATRIEDCLAMNAAHRRSGKMFATGFVLRYSPIYRKTQEIISSGKLGKIIAVEGNENIPPEHGVYIMCNWRRHSSIAGPHILEKCCHDLDLIEWITNSIPSRVAAFGGRNLFLPENRFLEKWIKRSDAPCWGDPHAAETPFSDDSDLMDNLISIAEFRNKARVSFTCTMSNAIPERRLSFCCTLGTLKMDLYRGRLSWRVLSDPIVHTYDFSLDGHGGGDDFIMKELFESMTSGSEPKCGGREGLLSAVYALALDKAATTGQIVDLEPIWKELGC